VLLNVAAKRTFLAGRDKTDQKTGLELIIVGEALLCRAERSIGHRRFCCPTGASTAGFALDQ